MVQLQYWNGIKWVDVGKPFTNETVAWVFLGGDDVNYRTVDIETGKVLTDRSI